MASMRLLCDGSPFELLKARLQSIILILCMVVFGLLSVHKGIDANADLQNYHFYNPWAFFHDRFLVDVAPAKSETYYNPAIDFFFYGLVAYFNNWPRLVAFALGALHGINAFLLILIARRLFAPAYGVSPKTHWILVGVATAIGVSGAGFLSLVGVTMGDLQYSIFVLCALLSTLIAVGCAPRLLPIFAIFSGFCIGLAIALKLVAIVYLAGIAAAGLIVYRRSFLEASAGFAISSAVGFAIGGGWYFSLLYRVFGNPFFPLLNNVFRSPFADCASYSDRSHLPTSLIEALLYPFLWAYEPSRVAQMPFRDPRIATVILMGVVLILMLAVRLVFRPAISISKEPKLVAEREFFVLALFCTISYVAWIYEFSIYRYLVSIEMLSGPLIVATLASIFRNPRHATWVSPLVMLFCISVTRPLDWGHAAIGAKYIDVQAPSIPANSVVVLTGFGGLGPPLGTRPLAHVLPFLNPAARFVKFDYQFLAPTQNNILAERGRALVLDRTRKLYTLRTANQDLRVRNRTFYDIGLRAREASCSPAKSNLAGAPIVLCTVERLD
jgi:hypothetical protein